MPTLEIPDALFLRLQKLAVPLVDTKVTLLERLVDFYETKAQSELTKQPVRPSSQKRNASETRELDPDVAPDLRHASVLAARFANRPATGWNKLVPAAHVEAISRLGSLSPVQGITRSNLIVGRPSSEDAKKGYRYVPEADISIQNVDAGHAWANALRLARYLNVEVRVDFEWPQKTDAAHPGEKGRLSWGP